MTRAADVAARLAAAGFIAAEEEAAELALAAADPEHLEALVARRLEGEPLAWITGVVEFGGVRVHVEPGVYVPRPHTELIAARAVERLPRDGIAIDLCTGCGALAAVLGRHRPAARVLASDVDERAVACAHRNGVEAFAGDLFAPLPPVVADVVVAVVPYVPTPELALLQRDTLRFETPLAYDGGEDGLALLRRVVAEAPRWLRPDGTLVLELGGAQADALRADLEVAGFAGFAVIADEDDDVRGIEATLTSSGTTRR